MTQIIFLFGKTPLPNPTMSNLENEIKEIEQSDMILDAMKDILDEISKERDQLKAENEEMRESLNEIHLFCQGDNCVCACHKATEILNNSLPQSNMKEETPCLHKTSCGDFCEGKCLVANDYEIAKQRDQAIADVKRVRGVLKQLLSFAVGEFMSRTQGNGDVDKVRQLSESIDTLEATKHYDD